MIARKARDPQISPSLVDRERALAAAMVAVWDSQTIGDIAASVIRSAANAYDFENAHPGAAGVEARIFARRLEAVYALLCRIEDARAFLEPGE